MRVGPLKSERSPRRVEDLDELDDDQGDDEGAGGLRGRRATQQEALGATISDPDDRYPYPVCST